MGGESVATGAAEGSGEGCEVNQFGDAYKKLEALGDRERVLAVWPDAHEAIGGGVWRYGYENGLSVKNRIGTDWADAASRLPVVAEPAAEGEGGERCPHCGEPLEPSGFHVAGGWCYAGGSERRWIPIPPVAEPAKGVQRFCKCGHHPSWHKGTGEMCCGGGVFDHCDCEGYNAAESNPPQPAKPEALVSDRLLERWAKDHGFEALIARECQAWRAWAKSGGGR
jgi:hypothetical protein